MRTLHHKAKRYEVQQYNHRDVAWKPVKHTDDPELALKTINEQVKRGYYMRVVDRFTRAVTEAKPKVPKYDCEYCNDSGEIISDTCDHEGEHVQHVYPCIECKL